MLHPALVVGVPALFSLDQLLQGLDLPGVADEPVLRSSLALGRSSASFTRHCATKSLKSLPKLPSRAGGGSLGIWRSTFMGCVSAWGGLATGHLDGGYAQRPYICAEVIARLLDHLGGHPEWCADERIPLRLDVGQLGCNAKIGELNHAGL